MKTLIIALTFFALCFASSGSIKASETAKTNLIISSVKKESVDENYTYVRVRIDDVWWIIVYDRDGNIVNIYEDEE